MSFLNYLTPIPTPSSKFDTPHTRYSYKIFLITNGNPLEDQKELCCLIDQFMIINDAGLPLFDWRPSEKGSDSNLVSGFLSALNMFATGERGEQIKKLTMDPTTFIFERAGTLVFVILTQDPQFEVVIYLILTKLKEAFLAKFGELAVKFGGNLSVFSPFYAILDQILKDYGYFDYMQAMASFSSGETLRAVMFVDKTSGKVIFLRSKDYIDREKISFQSVLLLKTFERLITGTFKESPIILNLISESMRGIILKSTTNIALLAEIKHKDAQRFPVVEITDKKIQTFLKKQYVKPNSGFNDIFLLFDENGKVLAKNDNQNRLKVEKSIVDCITLIKTASNMTNQSFKEKLFTILLGTPDNIYLLSPIGSLYAFLLIPTEIVSTIKGMYEKLQNFVALEAADIAQFGVVLKIVYKLQKMFA